MVCPRCKAEIAPGKAFCAECGQRIGMADGIRPPIAPAALRHRSPVITPTEAMPASVPATEPAETAEQPAKKGGRGGLVAGLLLLVLLVVGIFGGVWAYQGDLPVVGRFPFPELTNRIRSITTHGILDLVPEKTVMIAEINTDQDSASYTNLKTLWHLFPKYQEWEDSLFAGMTESDTADSGLTWADDVEPWLGNEAVLFIESIPLYEADATTTPDQPMGFILHSTDMDATRTFVNTLVEQEKAKATTSTYKGITIIQMESQNSLSNILPDANSLLSSTSTVDTAVTTAPSQSQIAYIDSYLVVTSTKAMMQKVIETYQGAANFSHKSGFSELKAGLPTEALARVYVDMGALLAAASNTQTDPTLTASTSILSDSSLTGAYGLSGFAVTSQKDGLLMTSLASYDRAKLSDAGITSIQQPFTPALVESVPGDTAFYTESNDLQASIQDILTVVGRSESGFDADYSSLKKQLAGFPFSFDIDEDLLGWMNNRYAVALAPQGDTFSVSLIFTIEDQAKASDGLDKLRSVLQTVMLSQLATSPSALPTAESLFKKQTIAGIDVWTLNYADLPDYAQISYAFVGSNLILTSNPQTIAKYVGVEAKTTASLAADPRFTSMFDRFPSEMTSLAYLNTDPLWTIIKALYTVVPEATDTPVDISMWEEDLAPFHGVMGVSTTDQDLEKGEIFISFQK